uniref:Col_cuticle_N domain-containing protein n=1 Tax=Rhabditophanes sp. KR3021 TaxID=114890 RepID=A0AC35TGD7_9BILA
MSFDLHIPPPGPVQDRSKFGKPLQPVINDVAVKSLETTTKGPAISRLLKHRKFMEKGFFQNQPQLFRPVIVNGREIFDPPFDDEFNDRSKHNVLPNNERSLPMTPEVIDYFCNTKYGSEHPIQWQDLSMTQIGKICSKSNPDQYLHMLLSALGGGLVVLIISILSYLIYSCKKENKADGRLMSELKKELFVLKKLSDQLETQGLALPTESTTKSTTAAIKP